MKIETFRPQFDAHLGELKRIRELQPKDLGKEASKLDESKLTSVLLDHGDSMTVKDLDLTINLLWLKKYGKKKASDHIPVGRGRMVCFQDRQINSAHIAFGGGIEVDDKFKSRSVFGLQEFRAEGGSMWTLQMAEVVANGKLLKLKCTSGEKSYVTGKPYKIEVADEDGQPIATWSGSIQMNRPSDGILFLRQLNGIQSPTGLYTIDMNEKGVDHFAIKRSRNIWEKGAPYEQYANLGSVMGKGFSGIYIKDESGRDIIKGITIEVGHADYKTPIRIDEYQIPVSEKKTKIKVRTKTIPMDRPRVFMYTHSNKTDDKKFFPRVLKEFMIPITSVLDLRDKVTA